MLKRDLIVRQMESFGRMLAKLLSFRRDQRWEDYQKATDEAFATFSASKLADLENLSANAFEAYIVGMTNPEERKIVAALLFERMLFYEAIADYDRAESQKLKCRMIYEFLASDLTENEYSLDVFYKLKFLSGQDPG